MAGALMRGWPLVGEAVEDPTTEPFVKENGEPALEYYTKREDSLSLLYKAMSGMCVPYMREMVQVYDGFQGVETLVDVGGNSGVTLRMIMDKYPNIHKGINYDFPDMVAMARPIPGVTHVGGNAFDSVPHGDAIFIKGGQMRKPSKCFRIVIRQFPEDGKMIVCEPVPPELTDESQRTRALLGGDIFIMTMYRTKGKHRTELQFKHLGISTGIPRFSAFYVDPYFAVLEFQK